MLFAINSFSFGQSITITELLVLKEVKDRSNAKSYLNEKGFELKKELKDPEYGWDVDFYVFNKGGVFIEFRNQYFEGEWMSQVTVYFHSYNLSYFQDQIEKRGFILRDKLDKLDKDGYTQNLYWGTKSLQDQLTCINLGYQVSDDGIATYRLRFLP